MMELLAGVTAFIREGGWLAVLVGIMFAGWRGWWHFPHVVRSLEARIVAEKANGTAWQALSEQLMDQQRRLLDAIESLSRRGR